MTETALRLYFDLPTSVKPGDFVHQIDAHADAAGLHKTLTDYQVTPSIARNFDHALDNVAQGLEDRRSVFTWVHGSFGCGKSHYMNLVSLLLADEKAVYSVHPELQDQRKRFEGKAIGRKLFRLHIQCISRQALTLEEIIFRAAMEELARQHPKAPVPALFEVQRLFTAAQRLLADLGDAKFFSAFPSNQAEADETWGELGSSAWSRTEFEAAIADPDGPKARALAGELAKTPWLEGMASGSELVKLGAGLQILAAHLQSLGYEGIVLFLDELVLWLSTFQDPKKLALEAPKVSTLIEHGDYPPAIPYFTFAARQRDLSQMVGKLVVGRDEQIFRDQLSFWKDRFDTISLEDKDLPRIVQKRLLKPKSDERRTEVDRGFEGWKRSFAEDFRKLNGEQGEPEDFRRVYPFSPALVEVMVALSATLQRERTALRELTRLLIDYLPDWELGKVVPIGDLFDVVVHGKTSDLPALQRVYEQARRIYDNDLLPHIRRKAKTDNPDKCQLLRERFDPGLGCSGCKERECRKQTRIAKTVLLQGLVPNTPVLKRLTASSLVYLNSGTLKSAVPNQETSLAAAFVREWAGVTPAIHVQGENNPEVSAILDTVDVRRILDSCRDLDNEQRRRLRVRDSLFKKMDVVTRDQTGTRTVEWRGRKWKVGVVYDNVRVANDNVFRPGPDEDLRLVVDFPFDASGHGPRDDEDRLQQVIEGLKGDEETHGLPTAVWLPAFLDQDCQDALRDLVILEGLVELRDHDLAHRVPWISMDDLPRVRSTLEQQCDHKRTKVENALSSAYGLTNQYDSALAAGLWPNQRVHLLKRGAKLSLSEGLVFDGAFFSIITQALETRAPTHPEFGKLATKSRLESVLAQLEALLETPERKARLDRHATDEMGAILGARNLQIVRVIENEDVHYVGGLLDEVARRLGQHRGPLSVGAVRAALDPDGLMWLAPEVEDFLVLAYARVAPKPLRFLAHGQPVNAMLGGLTDDMALVAVDLPSQESWQRALEIASLFGVVLSGRALTPSHVEELAHKAKKAAQEVGRSRAIEAITQLDEWKRLLSGDVGETPRIAVLRTIDAWVAGVLEAQESGEVVSALAQLEVEPARKTAVTYLANARRIDHLLETLRSEQHRTTILAAVSRESHGEDAQDLTPILTRLRRAFMADENVEALHAVLDREMARLTQLLLGRHTATASVTHAPATRAAAPGSVDLPVSSVGGRKPTQHVVRSTAELDKVMSELRSRIDSGERLRIQVEQLDKDEP